MSELSPPRGAEPKTLLDGVLSIACEHIKTGWPLPKDSELAEMLGTNRHCVGNAIYRLRQAGTLVTKGRLVLEIHPHAHKAPEPKKERPKAPTRHIDRVMAARQKVAALVSYCDWNGVPWPSSANICTALSISGPMLKNHLRALRDEGIIYAAAPGVYRMGAAP